MYWVSSQYFSASPLLGNVLCIKTLVWYLRNNREMWLTIFIPFYLTPTPKIFNNFKENLFFFQQILGLALINYRKKESFMLGTTSICILGILDCINTNCIWKFSLTLCLLQVILVYPISWKMLSSEEVKAIFGGHILKQVTMTTVLGTCLDENLLFVPHIEKQTDKAMSAVNKLSTSTLSFSSGGLSHTTGRNLSCGLIRP